MALRFRKSFKLAPGLRMNLSGSGVSWSVGPRGASVGISKRGTYLNTGIPGTGIFNRQKIGGYSANQRHRALPETSSFSITVEISDDGTIIFKNASGQELPESVINVAKKQHGETIRNLIQQKCDEINEQIESVGELHLNTPLPSERPSYTPRSFEVEKPHPPIPMRLGFFRSLFKSQRDHIEAESNAAQDQYDSLLANWEQQRSAFEISDRARQVFIELAIYTEHAAMDSFLEEALQDIIWPRETIISTNILDDGCIVFIDVDLPEIENMPCKTAAMPARGYKLSVKEMSPAHIQKLYMRHVHGIAFRTIGVAFFALPKVEEVVFSGFSQRADKTIGHVSDEYLLSVRVQRSAWAEINFENLDALDIVEVLTRFDLRRSMTKTGIFRGITPFSPSD